MVVWTVHRRIHYRPQHNALLYTTCISCYLNFFTPTKLYILISFYLKLKMKHWNSYLDLFMFLSHPLYVLNYFMQLCKLYVSWDCIIYNWVIPYLKLWKVKLEFLIPIICVSIFMWENVYFHSLRRISFLLSVLNLARAWHS